MQPDNEYDQQMTDKYLGQVKDEALTIENDPDLMSLQFMRNLNPCQLKLIFCKNIIPTLSSSTIKELDITYCNVQSLAQYQLENLEVLKLQCYKIDGVECTQILWNIVQYPKLQQLSLFGFVSVDVAPLSQITLQITKLSLNYCELQNVDHLKILANLKELNIAYNKYVDITALKDMSQLLALDLSFCSLEQIDTLRSLVNLKELKLRCNQVDITPLQYLSELVRIDLNSCGLCYISVLQYLPNLEEVDIANNSIIYIQPLQELNSIVELDARFNKIVDFHTIQYHPNHNKYHLDFQEQPTNEEVLLITLQQQEEIQYYKEMIIKYKQNVEQNKLLIQYDQQVTCLDFLQKLSIRILELENCENIIPMFTNNKIAELLIQTCNISNFKLIELNNLEILTLKSQKLMCAQRLIQSITKFKYLQELNIYGYNIIDLNPLLQMELLTRLSLSSCGLKDIENLRLLANLKSLNISENSNIDFTCLQYFTQLNVLNLRSCGLNTIDFLKNLVKLEKLNIKNNSIMHIQPVEDLNKLLILNAQNNRIIDEYKIVYHPHFKKFNFSDQEQPSEEIKKEIDRQRDSYFYKQEQSYIEKYQKQIIDGSLTIDLDPELLCLQFIRNFIINKLVINNCKNIIPILHNQNITELQIKNCNIQSIKQLNLENLEILQLESELSSTQLQNINRNSNFEKTFNDLDIQKERIIRSSSQYSIDDFACYLFKFKKLKILMVSGHKCADCQQISQMGQLNKLQLNYCSLEKIDEFICLINLKELQLCGNPGIDITPLQHLTQLTSLQLTLCGLKNIEILKNMVNLKELNLSRNNLTDITPLQYLFQLIILEVSLCNIYNIDAMDALINLEQLSLQSNNIVYIKPLKNLTKLLKLNIRYNQIEDINTIQNHPNFQKFYSNVQQQSQRDVWLCANKLRNINAPIYILKKIKAQRKKICLVQKNTINDMIEAQKYSQIAFCQHIVLLLNQINSIDTYQ
ncbi:Conserved_hypothetical protein [Hexamita inflata]|uniref:Uncharacterized protein n=1 Tax=Hexamita inflata TaxID=28002 RepID=A0AA86PVL5_9EUKA|nr:Conserved hypothetical protein [Hexamita inflata]